MLLSSISVIFTCIFVIAQIYGINNAICAQLRATYDITMMACVSLYCTATAKSRNNIIYAHVLSDAEVRTHKLLTCTRGIKSTGEQPKKAKNFEALTNCVDSENFI